MYRDNTKVIRIGNKVIGGGNPIMIQSMTNTKTEDVEATVAQIKELEASGVILSDVRFPQWKLLRQLRKLKSRFQYHL